MTAVQLSLLLGLGLLALVLGILVTVIKKKLALQAQSLALLNDQLEIQQKHINSLSEGVNEVRAGSMGMGSKLKQVTTELEKLQRQQDELVNADPDQRLYSTATRLVATGASVEDVMRECDLPRGEAELLISLHNK